jgi:hypothetical protein
MISRNIYSQLGGVNIFFGNIYSVSSNVQYAFLYFILTRHTFTVETVSIYACNLAEETERLEIARGR